MLRIGTLEWLVGWLRISVGFRSTLLMAGLDLLLYDDVTANPRQTGLACSVYIIDCILTMGSESVQRQR